VGTPTYLCVVAGRRAVVVLATEADFKAELDGRMELEVRIAACEAVFRETKLFAELGLALVVDL
ncbi:MAG TPA: hypothetical protein VN774_02945, partial [Candidatus Limnocylindrales bacterium]|nr:hypothetical protein [Candidatus Limnocylindrales bacterium]